MVQRIAAVMLAAGISMLAGCATNQQGWTGSGAQPFDQALSTCHEQVDTIASVQDRNAALEQCMAGKGWTRK